MKKLLLIILILFTGNSMASSLPDCPSDKSEFYHNCFGTSFMGDGVESYTGEWKNNTRNGQGTNSYVNGDKYVGEWKENSRHGKATYISADGTKYVGEFKDDKKNLGTTTFPDGDKYEGEYKENKRHGQGTYTFSDGAKHVGEFKDGKSHGQGTFTYPDGKKESGYYINGKYVPTICNNMGLTKGTESFGQCVVELIKQANQDD